MAYAKTSLRAEQRDLREQMRGHGLSRRQIERLCVRAPQQPRAAPPQAEQPRPGKFD
jgi:hypothetical protein